MQGYNEKEELKNDNDVVERIKQPNGIVGSEEQLIEGYYLKKRINLKKDSTAVLIINILCFLLMMTIALFGVFVLLAKFNKDELYELIRWPNFVVFGVGLAVYVFIHELLHALAIRMFNKDIKLQFFSNGVVSLVGAERKFSKWQYIFVQLFPFFVLTVVFMLCLFLLTLSVWLGFYFLLTLNLGSSAGDFYMVAKILSEPRDIKILHNGIESKVYYKKKVSNKQ